MRPVVTVTFFVAAALLTMAQHPFQDQKPSHDFYFESEWRRHVHQDPEYILQRMADPTELRSEIRDAVWRKKDLARSALEWHGISKSDLLLKDEEKAEQSTVERARMLFRYLNSEEVDRGLKMRALYTGFDMWQKAFEDLLKHKEKYDSLKSCWNLSCLKDSNAVKAYLTPEVQKDIQEGFAGSLAFKALRRFRYK